MSGDNNRKDMVETLRRVDVLRDIADEHLDELAAFTQCDLFPEGAVIFREGDPPSRIYLIDDGHVALEIGVPGGRAKRIMTLSSGELLGWTPLLGEVKMTATARTLSPTRACGIDARQILALCEQNPKFGYEFMRRTALAMLKRLTATRLQLLDVYQHDLPSAVDGEEGS